MKIFDEKLTYEEVLNFKNGGCKTLKFKNFKEIIIPKIKEEKEVSYEFRINDSIYKDMSFGVFISDEKVYMNIYYDDTSISYFSFNKNDVEYIFKVLENCKYVVNYTFNEDLTDEDVNEHLVCEILTTKEFKNLKGFTSKRKDNRSKIDFLFQNTNTLFFDNEIDYIYFFNDKLSQLSNKKSIS